METMSEKRRSAKVKMSGYLNLKTKKRMMSSWKTYWFVLEDRLLLYYRSKAEYEAISPCKGSINLGPPCAMKSLPSVPNAFQIETRSVTYTLKTDSPGTQKQWMQILLSALNQNQNFQPSKRLSHFRYSLDDLIPEIEPVKFERQHTLPHRVNEDIIQRLQKIGAQTYADNLSLSQITKKQENQSSDLDLYDTVVENDNYNVCLRGNVEEVKERETKSLIIENEQYGLNRAVQSEEAIYSEPKIDQNKNNLVVHYASSDLLNENLYEDLEKVNLYSQPAEEEEEEEKKIKKSKSFIKRMWKRKKKHKVKETEEEIYEEIDPIAVKKTSISDDNAIQMLSELHNILEKQKTKIQTAPNSPTATTSQSPTDTKPEYPTLPPKTHKASQDRSLDEILEDLEKIESKGNVKRLIEKFEPEVILRKKESDDLNELLDQLLQVTTAPILTPKTNSLGLNSNLTDEEWLQLLPIRQRRLSEPDYDIPRVHKSLQLEEKQEQDVIPATRFFGPVLTQNFIENKPEASMTPDSLEIEHLNKTENLTSYTSHNYFIKDEQTVYALPKSYVSVATRVVNMCPNFSGGAPFQDDCIIYKSVKNIVQEEIFKDSLECCDENQTEF